MNFFESITQGLESIGEGIYLLGQSMAEMMTFTPSKTNYSDIYKKYKINIDNHTAEYWQAVSDDMDKAFKELEEAGSEDIEDVRKHLEEMKSMLKDMFKRE